MNKRLPLLFTLLALILLAASIAYWFLQLYKPEQRPLAPAPSMAQAEPSPDAAASLFGGQPTVAAISNYQLTGVISAGRDSAVILVADGSPPKAVRIGREIVPGVMVAEVHARYVMLSDGGVMKRVDLAPDTGAASQMSGVPPPPVAPPVAAAPPPGVEPQTSPGAVITSPSQPTPPPQPGGAQGSVPAAEANVQPQQEPDVAENPQAPPPPNQIQMPPPTRSVNSPVGEPNQTQ